MSRQASRTTKGLIAVLCLATVFGVANALVRSPMTLPAASMSPSPFAHSCYERLTDGDVSRSDRELCVSDDGAVVVWEYDESWFFNDVITLEVDDDGNLVAPTPSPTPEPTVSCDDFLAEPHIASMSDVRMTRPEVARYEGFNHGSRTY